MVLLLVIFILAQICFSSDTSCKVVEIVSLEEVKNYVKPKSTLIYDIDETLAYSNNNFFHPRGAVLRKYVQQMLRAHSTKNTYGRFMSAIWQNTSFVYSLQVRRARYVF